MWGLGLQDIDVSSNHYNFRGWLYKMWIIYDFRGLEFFPGWNVGKRGQKDKDVAK